MFSRPQSRQWPDSGLNVSLIALGLLLSGWVITVAIACTLHKYIKTLHTKLDKIGNIPNRFNNSSARFLAKSQAAVTFPEN